MGNPFSWDSLSTAPGPDQVYDASGIVFLIVFGLGFLVSLVLYNDGAKRFIDHGLKRRLIQRAAGIAMLVFGLGLFFFAIRMLQINPFTFGTRFWLWLSVLALVGYLFTLLFYVRTNFARELREYEARRVRHQYTRPAALGATSKHETAIPLGKRPVRRRTRR
jgi:amino acid transporter